MATNNTGDNTDFYLMGSSEEQLFSSGQQDKVAATNATAGSNSNLLRSTNNGPKDLWSLIKDSKEREKKQADAEVASETTLFVVGNKNSGKSSLILRFLDRDEPPTPSVALEYTFGRKARGVNGVKDIVHIWELAGGTFLSDLIDIPITESNIHSCSLVVTVDLSKPSTILETLEILLLKLRTRVNQILDGLEQRGSKRPKALKQYAIKRFGSEHPDINNINLFPLPIVIVGTKYDELKDMESEKRKLLCKTLRFVAQSNGASLIFTSQKDEGIVTRFRQLFANFAFRSSSVKVTVTEHTKPLVIMAGQDTFSQLGLPPSEMAGNSALGRQTYVGYEKWKADFEKYFPTEPIQKTLESVDLSKFPEPAIDSMLAQKEDELDKIRKANERKAKEKSATNLYGNFSISSNSRDKKKGKAYSRANAAQMTVA